MIDCNKQFNNKMKYPEEFKEECIKTYPNNKDVKELLNKNSFLLGNLLNSLISDDDTLENQKRIDLYEKFKELYEEQYTSKGRFISQNGLVVYSDQVLLNYMIKTGEIEKVDKITHAQLASLERNISSRLEQNAERRFFGEEEAKKYYIK